MRRLAGRVLERGPSPPSPPQRVLRPGYRSDALADARLTDTAHLEALVEARAQSLELAVRAATALVVAASGRGMSAEHPAQRLLREAAFFTIQAQTPEVRRATLAQLMSRT